MWRSGEAASGKLVWNQHKFTMYTYLVQVLVHHVAPLGAYQALVHPYQAQGHPFLVLDGPFQAWVLPFLVEAHPYHAYLQLDVLIYVKMCLSLYKTWHHMQSHMQTWFELFNPLAEFSNSAQTNCTYGIDRQFFGTIFFSCTKLPNYDCYLPLYPTLYAWFLALHCHSEFPTRKIF